MIMSMGVRIYVSELRPLTGLLFIPQMMCEHGEPWWNDTDRVKLQFRSPELSGNPASSHLVASRRNLAKEIMNLALEAFLFILRSDFFTCRKVLRHGADGFTSPSMDGATDFYRPSKSAASAGYEPENLESNCKHANYYTTEATFQQLRRYGHLKLNMFTSTLNTIADVLPA
jgi:hypothetical protein